jgi:hypothetical protein
LPSGTSQYAGIASLTPCYHGDRLVTLGASESYEGEL